MAEEIQGINISDYKEKQEKGIINAVKLGDDFILLVKSFSADTGEEVKPSRAIPITLDQLDKMKVDMAANFAKQTEAHQKALADIDDIIAYLNSLE